MSAEYLAVLTTADSAERAKELAATAVEKQLAACAQIDGPIRSIYQWQGEIEDNAEWRVLYKTTVERYEELEAHIKSIHTYDTPEVIATPITDGSDEYLAWLHTETRG